MPAPPPGAGALSRPIADYAFLSDCESTCLIAPSGAVEWMCVPRPDSPSVFSAILDRSAGSFRLGPYDEMVPAARRYLPGSLMVETTWQTRTGWLIVRDTMCMGPWHNVDQRSKTHRRSPTDFDAEHCLLRTVRCVSGTVDLSMSCDPVFDYGRVEADWQYEGDGYGQVVATGEGVGRQAAGHDRPASRHRAARPERPHPHGRRRLPLRGPVVVAAARPAHLSPTPRSACTAPPSSGASGSRSVTSPTTAGGVTCSAAPSR